MRCDAMRWTELRDAALADVSRSGGLMGVQRVCRRRSSHIKARLTVLHMRPGTAEPHRLVLYLHMYCKVVPLSSDVLAR